METLGRYSIVGKIGEGGFGEVYEAFDPSLRRRVAIKTCRARHEEIRQRFEHEAALAASLDHRNLTATYDYDSTEETAYLVQEFLEGEDLDRKIEERQDLSFATRISYLIQLARGLAHAHRRRVIHRDVKPANVRVLPDGQVKLMDFGIAKSFDDDSQLTLSGETMGTAGYLSPEQIRGERVDQRCDIYSFGITAYELLTYRRAFPGEESDEVLRAVLSNEPAPIRDLWPDCPPALAQILERCYAKRRENRYGSFGEILAEFDSILGLDSPQREAEPEERSQNQATLVLPSSDDTPRTPGTGTATGTGAPTPHPSASGAHRAPGPITTGDRPLFAPSGEEHESGSPWLTLVGLLLMAAVGAGAAALFFTSAPADLSATAQTAEESAAPTPEGAEPPGRAGRGESPSSGAAAVGGGERGEATLLFERAWNDRMTATVAGRTVTIDREISLPVPAGLHTVLFELPDDPTTRWDDAQTESRTIRVEDEETVRIATTLRPPGVLTVRADLGAPRAFIRLGETPLGWLPIDEHVLVPGEYALTVSSDPAAESAEHTLPITVESGREVVVTVDVASGAAPRAVSKDWRP